MALHYSRPDRHQTGDLIDAFARHDAAVAFARQRQSGTPPEPLDPPRPTGRDRVADAAGMLFGGLCIAALGGPLLWAAFR